MWWLYLNFKDDPGLKLSVNWSLTLDLSNGVVCRRENRRLLSLQGHTPFCDNVVRRTAALFFKDIDAVLASARQGYLFGLFAQGQLVWCCTPIPGLQRTTALISGCHASRWYGLNNKVESTEGSPRCALSLALSKTSNMYSHRMKIWKQSMHVELLRLFQMLLTSILASDLLK